MLPPQKKILVNCKIIEFEFIISNSYFLVIVYEVGVIFKGHLAPLPKQFPTSLQVTYIIYVLVLDFVLKFSKNLV